MGGRFIETSSSRLDAALLEPRSAAGDAGVAPQLDQRRARTCSEGFAREGRGGDAGCSRCDGAGATRAQAQRFLTLRRAVPVQVPVLPLEEVVGVVPHA